MMHLLKYKHYLHTRVFILLSVTFIWVVAVSLLEFVLPTYLQQINKSYFEIGLLFSLAAISGMLFDLPLGLLSNRVSRKRLMITGLFFLIITTLLIFVVRGNIFLALIFMLWGLAYQLWLVPRDAQFASLTDQTKRATFYGFDNEIKYLGQTIGPLIAGFILLYLGFTGIVSVYTLLLILTILILFKYIKETDHRSILKAVAGSTKFNTLLAELKEIKIFGWAGIVFLYFSLLFAAWGSILWTLEPLFYGPDVLNIPPHLGGLLLATFFLPGIFLSYFAGKLADIKGKVTVLFIGLILLGLALLLFSIVNNLFIIFIFALLCSVGWTISLPALNGLIIDLSYRHRKGEIAGIWNFFMDIGFTIGPLLGGFIASLVGIRAVFFIIGVLFIISSIPLIKIKQHIVKRIT